MSADISSLIEQIRAGLGNIPPVHIGDWSWEALYERDPAVRQQDRAFIAACSPDNIRRLLEHIAELEARTEWRDMESAPRDRTKIMLWADGRVWPTAWYAPADDIIDWPRWEVRDPFSRRVSLPTNPDHFDAPKGWMPLPSSPGGRDHG